MSFQINKGQTDPWIDLPSRGAGYSPFLTPTRAVLSLEQGNTSDVVGMPIVGANPSYHAVCLDKQAGGGGSDTARGIAVNGSGDAFVTGTTNSSNYRHFSTDSFRSARSG